MTKYLQRFSFTVSFYDKETFEELVNTNKYLNDLKSRLEYNEYYKNNPNSVKVKYDYLTNRMSGMAHFIGDLLKKTIGKYEIKNTAIINFNLNNNENTPEKLSLGDYVNFCGIIYRHYDWRIFLALSDSEKRKSLLDFIYNSLLLYTSEFGLEKNSIIEAYNLLKNTELSYMDEKHLYLKRNEFKLYKTFIYNFENVEWGIVYENLKTGKKQRIDICKKNHYYGVEEPWLSLQEIMEKPMFLEYKGYDKEMNTYEMSYGTEKYSLDLKTLKINAR